jgi:anthranilate phosphoribosyltransferase
MNAAAALVVGGKARDLKEGVGLAAVAIDSGAARRKLEALIQLSRRLKAGPPAESPRRPPGPEGG